MSNAKSRILMFVVGMHRSGTSALVSAFCACGATVGDDVLAPLAGVNEDGFWEDRTLVKVNEALLSKAGLNWYSIQKSSKLAEFDEGDIRLGKKLLERGFGAGKVEILKDPRLSITLPFWLMLCEELNIDARVCVIKRNAMESALSLEKRDGFPVSYGLSLVSSYQDQITQSVKQCDLIKTVEFAELLESPTETLKSCISDLRLPLSVDSIALSKVIRPTLKHQNVVTKNNPEVSNIQKQLVEVVNAFVVRGQKLSALGKDHSDAIAVIEERDKQLSELNDQLSALGRAHSLAVTVVEERDRQLNDLNDQLTALGRDHAYALTTIEERDKQLQDLNIAHDALGKDHGYALSIIDERDKQIQELNNLKKVIKQKDDELFIHRSWKNKISFTLGLSGKSNKL